MPQPFALSILWHSSADGWQVRCLTLFEHVSSREVVFSDKNYCLPPLLWPLGIRTSIRHTPTFIPTAFCTYSPQLGICIPTYLEPEKRNAQKSHYLAYQSRRFAVPVPCVSGNQFDCHQFSSQIGEVYFRSSSILLISGMSTYFAVGSGASEENVLDLELGMENVTKM